MRRVELRPGEKRPALRRHIGELMPAGSVRTFNQCDVHLHDPVNYGTPYSTWIDASANLANIGTGWNNRASSIGISRRSRRLGGTRVPDSR